MSRNVSGSRSMYSVRMAAPTSSPSSSAVRIWQRKYCEKYDGAIGSAVWLESSDAYSPSDESDAPDSLNNSLPIWMGKTRSRGRMLGMWWTFFSSSGVAYCASDGAELGLAGVMAWSGSWVPLAPVMRCNDSCVMKCRCGRGHCVYVIGVALAWVSRLQTHRYTPCYNLLRTVVDA